MGSVEICMNEEGALKVVRHYDLRVWLRRLRPEDGGCHRVVTWPNCQCWSNSVGESKFNRVLMFIFLFTLGLALINIIYSEQRFTYRCPSYDLLPRVDTTAVVLLAVFALAVLVVGVFVKKALKNTRSVPPRREEVQTITGLLEKF